MTATPLRITSADPLSSTKAPPERSRRYHPRRAHPHPCHHRPPFVPLLGRFAPALPLALRLLEPLGLALTAKMVLKHHQRVHRVPSVHRLLFLRWRLEQERPGLEALVLGQLVEREGTQPGWRIESSFSMISVSVEEGEQDWD